MLVREWMTGDPTTVDPRTSIFHAWEIMQEQRIRHLPVLDEGALVGIVTDRDLRLTLPSPAANLGRHEVLSLLRQLQVAEVMTREVICTTPHTAIRAAAQALMANRVGALPVTEGDALVGILTRTDVLEAFVSSVWAERADRPAVETTSMKGQGGLLC